jgi:hypothetical protein
MRSRRYHLTQHLKAVLTLGIVWTLTSCSSEHASSTTTSHLQPATDTVNTQSTSGQVLATPPQLGDSGAASASARAGCETPTTGRLDYLAGSSAPAASAGIACASTAVTAGTANVHVIAVKATFSANVQDQVATAVEQYKETHP